MSNNVLYFPYIRVPKSSWFTRILLYWDSVGVIVPYDFIEDPDKLDPHTRSLIQANLVTQVVPAAHLWQIPRFSEAFLEYLQSLGGGLDSRKQSFLRKESRFLIHAEKMFRLTEPLEEMGLITPSRSYPWYEVEADTGRDFMGYLAAALGKAQELEFTPITDNPKHLSEFIQASIAQGVGEDRLSNLREEVLGDLFPAPSRALSASEIENFKLKHGELLSQFRRALEKELIDIADLQDSDLQRRRLGIFQEQYSQEINEVKNRIAEMNWGDLNFRKVVRHYSRRPRCSTNLWLGRCGLRGIQG